MNRTELPFQDRTEAGRLLAAELTSRKLPDNTIVLALPRGGLPVGFEVADALHAPLDVIVVRKLGVPWQRELAMGAIAGGTTILDHQLIYSLGIIETDVAGIITRERKETERREKLYRSGRQPLDLHERTVLIVDDGLATGSTMLAASREARSMHPKKLIIAVPVGSSSACIRLRSEVDELVCLATPEPFSAVGEWYLNFRQVTDDEVREILTRANVPAGAGAGS